MTKGNSNSPFVSREEWERIWPLLRRRYWSKEKTYAYMVELERTARRLEAEAETPLSFRSSVYDMDDRGIAPGSVDSAVTNLNYVAAELKDLGVFPWGIFSGSSVGASLRGYPQDELEEIIINLRERNVIPVATNGILWAIWVEKAGLLRFLRKATGGRIPVGSAEGMVRKEWAHENFIPDVIGLANRLGAELRILYVGDGDDPGWKIRDEIVKWTQEQFQVKVVPYAVSEAQVAERGRVSIHLDGYIALVRPRKFAKDLNEYLGHYTLEA